MRGLHSHRCSRLAAFSSTACLLQHLGYSSRPRQEHFISRGAALPSIPCGQLAIPVDTAPFSTFPKDFSRAYRESEVHSKSFVIPRASLPS